MSKITLTGTTFALVPEGVHVFQITKVSYKEEYGKMEITMKTKNGYQHIERYSLLKGNGEVNEPALNAYSYLAKTALQDFNLVEIDTEDIVGKFIKAEVVHERVPSTSDPSKEMVFCRLASKTMSDGYEDAPETVKISSEKTTPAETPAKPAPKPKLDLDAILGRK